MEINRFELVGNPQLGIPLAQVRISAEKAIDHFDKDGIVITDDNGALSIVYRSSETVFAVGDLLTIPDQYYSDQVDLTPLQLAALLGTGSLTIEGSQLMELDMPAGDRLDSVRFAQGNLRYFLNTSGSFPLSGHFEIRSADNQQSLLTIPVPAMPAPGSFEENIDFAERLLSFVNAPGMSNALRISWQFTLTNKGAENAQPVHFGFDLTNLSVKSAGGYIAPRTILIEDKAITVTMFNGTPDYEIHAEQPLLNFHMRNSFGLGLGMEILHIRGFNALNAMLDVTADNIFIAPYLAPAPSPGLEALSTVSVTNNSMRPTVSEFFSFKPNYISGDIALEVNPLDEPAAFITSDSEIALSFEADIPIFGSISNFYLRDTTDISLGDVIKETEKAGYINQFDLRIIVANGLPLETGLQLVFCDSLYNPLDSLFEAPQYVFNSAPVNHGVSPAHPDYGRANGTAVTVLDIPIPRERITALRHVSRMIVTVFGNTTTNGSQSVRFFSGDEIEVKVGAKISLNYESF